jgi:hypothetical protein
MPQRIILAIAVFVLSVSGSANAEDPSKAVAAWVAEHAQSNSFRVAWRARLPRKMAPGLPEPAEPLPPYETTTTLQLRWPGGYRRVAETRVPLDGPRDPLGPPPGSLVTRTISGTLGDGQYVSLDALHKQFRRTTAETSFEEQLLMGVSCNAYAARLIGRVLSDGTKVVVTEYEGVIRIDLPDTRRRYLLSITKPHKLLGMQGWREDGRLNGAFELSGHRSIPGMGLQATAKKIYLTPMTGREPSDPVSGLDLAGSWELVEAVVLPTLSDKDLEINLDGTITADPTTGVFRDQDGNKVVRMAPADMPRGTQWWIVVATVVFGVTTITLLVRYLRSRGV